MCPSKQRADVTKASLSSRGCDWFSNYWVFTDVIPCARGWVYGSEYTQHPCLNPGASKGEGQTSTQTYPYDLQRAPQRKWTGCGARISTGDLARMGQWGRLRAGLTEPGVLKAGQFKSLLTTLSSYLKALATSCTFYRETFVSFHVHSKEVGKKKTFCSTFIEQKRQAKSLWAMSICEFLSNANEFSALS